MGWAPLAATAASTLLQLKSGDAAANAQNDAYVYQASQQEADALANTEAAKVRATKIRKMGDTARGEATAAFAGSGVDVGSGSALEVDKNITANSEEDAWMTVYNSVLESNRMRVQAYSNREAGRQVLNANKINQFSTLANGLMNGYSGWKNMAKSAPATDAMAGSGAAKTSFSGGN